MKKRISILIGMLVVMLGITLLASLGLVQAQAPEIVHRQGIDATIAAADAAKLKRQSELAATYQAVIAETRSAQATAQYWARETVIAQTNATATAVANATATGIANVTATARANATATAQAKATSAAKATLASKQATATYEAEQYAENMRRQKERADLTLKTGVAIGLFLLIAIGIKVYRSIKPPKQKTIYVAAPIEDRPKSEPTLKDLTANIPKPNEIDVELNDAASSQDLWQHLQDEGIRPE
jgi:hypothetical protein